MGETPREQPTQDEIDAINEELSGANFGVFGNSEEPHSEEEPLKFPESLTPANNPEIPMFTLPDAPTKPVASSEQGTDQKGGDVGAAG